MAFIGILGQQEKKINTIVYTLEHTYVGDKKGKGRQDEVSKYNHTKNEIPIKYRLIVTKMRFCIVSGKVGTLPNVFIYYVYNYSLLVKFWKKPTSFL